MRYFLCCAKFIICSQKELFMGGCKSDIRSQLLSMKDDGYRTFQCGLVPNIDPSLVIGVRTPVLRAYAKEIANSPEAQRFLHELPHMYYDENNLHALLIERIKGFDNVLSAVNAFLPYIDNWATCDILVPKAFKGHQAELEDNVFRWIRSTHTYTVRFGIGMLMRFYLDSFYRDEYPEIVSGIESDEYYVNMMIAWYFATALAKQYDRILPFLERRRIKNVWAHNKAIQKSIESRRITAEQKAYLRTLKITH